jgi:outer membrane lipoprotein SlyB
MTESPPTPSVLGLILGTVLGGLAGLAIGMWLGFQVVPRYPFVGALGIPLGMMAGQFLAARLERR